MKTIVDIYGLKILQADTIWHGYTNLTEYEWRLADHCKLLQNNNLQNEQLVTHKSIKTESKPPKLAYDRKVRIQAGLTYDRRPPLMRSGFFRAVSSTKASRLQAKIHNSLKKSAFQSRINGFRGECTPIPSSFGGFLIFFSLTLDSANLNLDTCQMYMHRRSMFYWDDRCSDLVLSFVLTNCMSMRL